MSIPHRHGGLMQRIILPRKSLPHIGRARQPSIQRVAPSMVRTLNASGEFALDVGTQARPTMPANVVERANRMIRPARHNYAIARNLAQKVVTRIGNRLGAPRPDPASPKEALHFLAEHIEAGVVASR